MSWLTIRLLNSVEDFFEALLVLRQHSSKDLQEKHCLPNSLEIIYFFLVVNLSASYAVSFIYFRFFFFSIFSNLFFHLFLVYLYFLKISNSYILKKKTVHREFSLLDCPVILPVSSFREPFLVFCFSCQYLVLQIL